MNAIVAMTRRFAFEPPMKSRAVSGFHIAKPYNANSGIVTNIAGEKFPLGLMPKMAQAIMNNTIPETIIKRRADDF